MEIIKFIQRLDVRFTDEEKEACLPDIDTMLKLVDMARTQGILAFYNADFIGDDAYVWTAISLIIDGLSRDEIIERLQLLILADGKTGAQQLRRFIYMVGFVSLLYGNNPMQIKRVLIALLGEHFAAKYDAEQKATAHDPAKIRDFLDGTGEFVSYIFRLDDYEFKYLIRKMSDSSVQRVMLYNNEKIRLATALMGIDESDVREKVYRNLSTNKRNELIATTEFYRNDRKGLWGAREEDVKSAIAEIVELINKLDNEGMIYIERSREQLERRAEEKRTAAIKDAAENISKLIAETGELLEKIERLS